MTDPRNLRLIVDELRSALDKHTREELAEMLGYLFKEYVIGVAPAQAGAGALLDAKSELDGLSFAQLITWLQQHLDVPELALFDVQGARVSVRAGGRPIAISADAPEPVAAPPPPAPVIAPTTPPPAPVAPPPAPVAQEEKKPEPAPAPAATGKKRLEVD
jgi:hypothetical protein